MKKIKKVLGIKSNLDIEILLAHALKKSRVFLLTNLDSHVGFIPYLRFKYYNWQYSRGYSVAAIIHHKEFFGLDFYVDKNVLIPRPETELLIETAIGEIIKISNQVVLIDVGTGSGCIPISIAKNITKKINILAVDISVLALRVAKINAKKHQVDIKFFHGDLLSPILKLPPTQTDYPMIITANLPYLTDQQLESEPSIQREPKIALVAKNNGLALYEKLLEQIKYNWLNKEIILLIEIDPTQTEQLKSIIVRLLPNAKIEIKKDLAGLDRLIKIST